MNAQHNPYTCPVCTRVDVDDIDEPSGGAIVWLIVVFIALAALGVLWLMGATAQQLAPSAGAAVWAGVELIGRWLA